MRLAELGVLQAGQHAGQLADPASWSRRITLVLVIEPSPDLATTRWLSANAATCGRWVTTMTWASLASLASRRPISTAALPPTPGVHLVEDERRDRVGAGEHHLDREHHPGQLAAGGALVQRQGGRARVRGEPDLHVVGAVRARLGERR